MLKRSESYMIGVDVSQDDEPCITVMRCLGNRYEMVNTFTGVLAENFIDKFIDNSWKEKVQNV